MTEKELVPIENKIKILHQGAPIVNTDGGYIIDSSNNIILLSIDMHSKHCEILGYGHGDGCPSILIVSTGHSLHLNEHAEGSNITELDLCGYKDWQIFLADISRYTLKVCLTKELS